MADQQQYDLQQPSDAIAAIDMMTRPVSLGSRTVNLQFDTCLETLRKVVAERDRLRAKVHDMEQDMEGATNDDGNS